MRRNVSLANVLFRSGTIVSQDGDEAKATFIASNEEVDRYGDIVRAAGWQLDNFKNNPQLLFGHKSREPPVGKVDNIYIEGTKLIADVSFTPKDVYEFGYTIGKMVKAGYLNATSVGFLPTKMPNDIKDPTTNAWTGYEFIGQELLELSVVPVPAVPGALAIARSLNVGEEFVRRLMPDVLNVEPGASAFHAARQREVELLRLRTFA